MQNKEVVSELFREIAPKVSNRNGGYTRIIRTGYRLGDNAEMCMIELVDFNELYTKETVKKTTRRSRRGGATAKKAEETAAEEVVEATVVEDSVDTEANNESEAPESDDASDEEAKGE